MLVVVAIALGLGLAFGACTQDDAFISFRYAENLVAGHGLVYNPGEWVEGFTNLSWTLMVAAGIGLGLEPVSASVGMGLVSLALLILWTGRMAAPGSWGLWLAPLWLAVDAQVALEAVEGLETCFFAFLVAGSAAAAVRGRSFGQLNAWLIAAVLTRPEGLGVALLLHGGLALSSSDLRVGLRRSCLGMVPVLAVVAALTLWRLSTYGVPLPNTFYAKTGAGTGALARGVAYLWTHAAAHPILWLGALVGIGLHWRHARTQILATLVIGYLAYVAWVGGDFKPTGRFVIPVLAPMAVLAAMGVEALRRRLHPALLGIPLIVAVVCAVARHQVCQGWAVERHANLEARKVVGDWLAERLPPTTVLAIHSAGAIPYFSGLPTIDMWGLTDAHIARASVADLGAGLAGHERGDPAYVFSRNPHIYIPEDKGFVRRAWQLEPEAGFPEDFAERYNSVSIPVAGRWLNLWVRKGYLASLRAGAPQG
jgi:hypothetical protein